MERYDWLRYLIKRFDIRSRGDEANRRLHKLLTDKLSDLPDRMFTPESLEYAVKVLRSADSPSRVRKVLQGYPMTGQDEPDPAQVWDDPSLDGRDRVTIDIWRQWRADGFVNRVPGRDYRERYTQFLSVQRQYLPRVFRFICHNDREAADIAVSNGWQVDPSAMRIPTPEEIAAVEARVREAIAAGPLYQQSGGKLAPDAPIPTKPRHLDAATLDAVNPLPGGAKRHVATPAATDRPIDEPVSAARVAKPDPSAGDGQTGEPTVSAVPEAAGPAWHEARPVNEP